MKMLKVLLPFVLLFVSWNTYAFKVGVIIGQLTNKTSTSNYEKLCIMNSVIRNDELGDLEFVFKDNNRSAYGSAVAAKALIEDDVDLVLLPLISQEAIAASKILLENNIPYITTATSREVVPDSSLGLSMFTSNDEQIHRMVELYLRRYKGKEIVIIYDPANKYSVESKDSFIKETYKLYDLPKIEMTTLSVQDSNSVDELKNKENYVIFAPLYNPYIATLYSKLTKFNRDVIMLGTDSVGVRKEFFQIINRTSDKVNFSFVRNWDGKGYGNDYKRLKSFLKTFCDNQEPTFLSMYSYDLIKMILDNKNKLNSSLSKKRCVANF
ncbi:ABC transporter substrate-binding protein [Vibrio mediterranei]|uniref:ABC transporter substrate-binding protein n=1 Tax=Vibrio mediterranei TaxID=689 RepID=UPI00148CC267|nr:ABC transporter substrate-binding protein [Vibrio mediterranei]NOI26372.1 amino acid ABC transporter substrate-binding protein [Vibrio mediterranei]